MDTKIQLVLLLLLIAGSTSATAQSIVSTTLIGKPPEEPRTVHVTEGKQLRMESFPVYGAASMDKEGRAYYQFVPPPSLKSSGGVLGILNQESDPTYFIVPEDLRFARFSVTPSGKLWILTYGDGATALRYSSKGEIEEKRKLLLPEHLYLREFAVLDMDIFLVGGFYLSDAPEALRGQQYWAILSRDGKVSQTLTLSKEIVDPKTTLSALYPGGAVAAEDGNFYYFTNDHLYEISPLGEVGRSIAYDLPKRHLLPFHLNISAGLAVLWLEEENANHGMSISFLELDLQTGESLGWYAPLAPRGLLPIGFSRKEGMQFLCYSEPPSSRPMRCSAAFR